MSIAYHNRPLSMNASSVPNLGFLLVSVSRLMRRAFQQAFAGTALTPAQARTLVYVWRNQGARQVQLAEMLEIQPITLARQLDRLEEAGLVERRADPKDRRAYRVFVQPAANEPLEEIFRVAEELHQKALAGIDPASAAVLQSALLRMQENLSGDSDDSTFEV